MKCPFELPVEKEISTQDASGKTYYRIIDANKRSIAAGLTEKNADCIVQAINNYEKLRDLKRLGREYIEISEEVLKDQMVNVELGYRFRQKKEIFEQALKEAEEPK